MAILIPVFALLIACLGLSWFFIPIFSGIPWVPTKSRRIRKALELANLRPNERIYDLGCGDGRVLIIAARSYGANAIGIEISPLHCLITMARIWIAGVGKHATIRWGNFYRMNFSDADVVYQYGLSRYAERLKQRLEKQLHAGTRVVSINVDIPGWQPQAIDQQELIFVYRMPPQPGDIASYMMQAAGSLDDRK
jgi:SAM-dependent methyltransferase